MWKIRAVTLARRFVVRTSKDRRSFAAKTAPLDPFVLAVAPNGARLRYKDNPFVPLNNEELAKSARLCEASGATAMHFHVRDDEGRHTLDPERVRGALKAMRSAVGPRMCFQMSTESAGRYTATEQLDAVREAHPEAASVAVREVASSDENADRLGDFVRWADAEGIGLQYILYNPDDVDRLRALRDANVVPSAKPLSVLFALRRAPWGAPRLYELLEMLAVAGVTVGPAIPRFLEESGAPGDPRDFTEKMLQDWRERFEAAQESRAGAESLFSVQGSSFMACGFGPLDTLFLRMLWSLGGHARVGLENNVTLAGMMDQPVGNPALVAASRKILQEWTEQGATVRREWGDIRTARRVLGRPTGAR